MNLRISAAPSLFSPLTCPIVSQILSQEHSGFSVWLGEPFVDADSKRFVARYIERGPVSLEKLSLHDDLVTYTTEDGKAHEFDALEFLALLSSHITKPYESVTRYYGAWSCRTRGKTRELIALGELHPDEKPARPSATWAACIKRMYEVDPLQCPKCKGQMYPSVLTQPNHAKSALARSISAAGAHEA